MVHGPVVGWCWVATGAWVHRISLIQWSSGRAGRGLGPPNGPVSLSELVGCGALHQWSMDHSTIHTGQAVPWGDWSMGQGATGPGLQCVMNKGGHGGSCFLAEGRGPFPVIQFFNSTI